MYNIDDFIPHRDRMRLVNKIIEVDDDHCVTLSIASSLWPLCDGNRINSIIIVELVAQTVSVYIGWKKRNNKKMGGKGMIVGIKNATLSVPYIPVGSKLITSCRMLANIDDHYSKFEGEVKDDHTSYGYVHIQALSQ